MRIVDTITPNIKFEIDESASEVDGNHILAKVKGEFFVPDGVSRNKRFYPKELWEKVIASPDIQRKLGDRLMFGTIGHDGEIGEKGIREGMVSHAMTDLKIEDGKGIGEALIFNTPTGKILNTLLRAKCKFRVSSRANGSFQGEHNGMPVVDKNNYDVDGWDFVIDPGFLQANPSIAESFNNLQKNTNSETLLQTEENEESMTVKTPNDTLVQHIVDENVELKKTIGKLTEELDAANSDKEKTEKEAEELKAKEADIAEKLAKLSKYEELGEPEELMANSEEEKKDEEDLEKFRELGDSPEEVKEALITAQRHLTLIRESFGTVPQIKKALTEAIEFKKKVDAVGTVDEIIESLNTFKKLVEEEEQETANAEAQALADELGLSLEEVKELLTKHSAEEIRNMHKKVAEAVSRKQGNNRTTVTESVDGKFVKKPAAVLVENTESLSEGSTAGKSRLDRMNEQLAR